LLDTVERFDADSDRGRGSDEQLDEALLALREILAARAEAASVIEQDTARCQYQQLPDATTPLTGTGGCRHRSRRPTQEGAEGGNPAGRRDFAFALVKMK
jgi:hypothetical protein